MNGVLCGTYQTAGRRPCLQGTETEGGWSRCRRLSVSPNNSSEEKSWSLPVALLTGDSQPGVGGGAELLGRLRGEGSASSSRPGRASPRARHPSGCTRWCRAAACLGWKRRRLLPRSNQEQIQTWGRGTEAAHQRQQSQ